MKIKPTTRAFTLIELLVVVSIIALLSSIILGALQDARAKARDRALFSGVLELQKAVESYKTQYGVYPTYSGTQTAVVGRTDTGQFTNSLSVANPPTAETNSTARIEIEKMIGSFPQPFTSNSRIYYLHYPSSVGYTGSRARCSNQTYAPYIITFEPETNAFSNLPDVLWQDGSVAVFTGAKCISSN